MNRTLSILGIATALVCAVAGCKSDEGGDIMPGRDTGPIGDVGPLPDAGNIDSGNTDAGPPPGCPAEGDRTEVRVGDDSDEITSDTTWDCEHTYVLSTLIFVTGGTLTIEPGTVVKGENESALVITRGAHLNAEGTSDAPIVFTSAQDVGSRARRDWGGVALLGRAPGNLGVDGAIEGIESTDSRGTYGGSDSEWDCGTLAYARIEFAGYPIGSDNELNELTLAGCGSNTDVHHVQLHLGEDDGVEVFGGSVNLHHIVVTGAKDDSLDWDEGWTGSMQFLVVQQHAGVGDSAFEADNLEENNDATPRSAPTMYNVTLIGTRDSAASQRAMVLRRGTRAIIRNALIVDFPTEAIDVRDGATVAGTEDGTLTVDNSLFFSIGSGGTSYFSNEPTADVATCQSGCGKEDMACRDNCAKNDDGGFVESDYFTNEARNNVFGADPDLTDAFNLTAPNWVPSAESPVATGAATPSAGFDATATYMGAFAPGGADWTDGWTAYPEN